MTAVRLLSGFPVQLEWNMKLWWPHCEALISYLMAYDHLRDPAMLERFAQVYDYTFTHVSEVLTWHSRGLNTPKCLLYSD